MTEQDAAGTAPSRGPASTREATRRNQIETVKNGKPAIEQYTGGIGAEKR